MTGRRSGEKLVAYQETYRDHYPVDASLTDEEAVEKIRNDIMIGKENGPETCIGSDCYVVPEPDIPEGHVLYWVPFAYERYGKLPVVVPKGTSAAELFREAENVLDKLTVAQMDEYTEHLSDSEEIDRKGNVKDGDGNIVWNIGTIEE